jgi:uncharacterized protein (DUF1778 family)
MHYCMHKVGKKIKHIQARVDLNRYEKLKKAAEMRKKSLNEALKEAIDEYAERHSRVDSEDILFVSEKFDFEEEDLSKNHAKYRFR